MTGRPTFSRAGIQLGIENKIEFTGRLSEHSVNIHSKADLRLCSRFDGFGLTIMEAMLAGRPVIVSREAGVSEFVEKAEAGFLVKPEPESIANGIKAAWERKAKLKEMGQRGQEYVCNHLTWEKVAKRSMETYRQVFNIR